MKRRKPGIIKDPNIRGEWVESVFMVRAGEQGLVVSKPWGDSRSYDFVVGRPGRFVSVQVKSTTVESGGGYACAIRKQRSEEHTSKLQSPDHLVCRLLLEKKKKK